MINQIHGHHKDYFSVLPADTPQHCKLQSSEVACVELLLLLLWENNCLSLLHKCGVLQNGGTVEKSSSLRFFCAAFLPDHLWFGVTDTQQHLLLWDKKSSVGSTHRGSVRRDYINECLIPVTVTVLPSSRNPVPLRAFCRCCWSNYTSFVPAPGESCHSCPWQESRDTAQLGSVPTAGPC